MRTSLPARAPRDRYPDLQQADSQPVQQQTDVLLISMPFAPLLVPSMGLSSLQAGLRPVRAKILYLSLPFAGRIGVPLYQAIASDGNTRRFLTGDWLFSSALFGASRHRDERYLQEIVGGHDLVEPVSKELVDQLLRARAMVPSFLTACLGEILPYQPKIVGFTSVYQQQVASLALAKLVKEACPGTSVVFGGTSCDGIMGHELIRQFQWIDAVVSGEGDIVFPELVTRLLEGRSPVGLQGVLTRPDTATTGDATEPTRAPAVEDMDSLPFPDFDDFFEQWDAARLDTSLEPELIFETSRGCWWGQIRHCTFCGFNGQAMTYRSKSAGRVRRELEHLLIRHPVSRAFAADNILDMKYFDDLLPEMAAKPLNVRFFYPVRPNLTKEHLRIMRDAGVVETQPGLESLSTQVLKLMHKGVTALQNVQHLKWCRELGIRASWLFLWGFPGESPEEYQRMARLIPLLTHLDPPTVGSTIRIDRFSPNFNHSSQLGFKNLSPFAAYQYVYPLGEEALRNLAFSFTFEYQSPQDVAGYTRPVADAILEWRSAHETSNLVYTDTTGTLLIWDFRPGARQRVSTATGLQRALFLECDGIRSLARLQALAERETAGPCSKEEVEEELRPLLERGLMIREGDSFLSLAVPVAAHVQ